MSERRRAAPQRLRGALLLALGGAGLVALLAVAQPRAVADAIARIGFGAMPTLIGLSLLYYLLQGLRWHQLLRAAGIRLSRGNTVLLNYAGQATGLLPAGELARVALVVDATAEPFPRVLATVTVQELIYTLLLLALAVPSAIDHPPMVIALLVALVGTLAVLLLLCTPAMWRPVGFGVARIPLLRRLTAEIDMLRRDTEALLRRSDTFWWSALSLLGAMVAVTLFWLVVHLLAPGAVNWETAASILAVSHVAGSLSAIPGGLGVYEGTVAGLLIAAGVDPGSAAAAALLTRACDKGLMTLVGLAALAASRRALGGGERRRPIAAQ
ncbi:MAG TPA: lysylphosphatidylglycerol synthase transmembrane domain-containing protein [Candidatus Dormibacteraeota bacterium]